MEPIESIAAMAQLKNQNNIQKEFAKKVATNLYNYMSSFDKQTGTLADGSIQEYYIVPSTIFDKWYEKFEKKFDIDPNFINKTPE